MIDQRESPQVDQNLHQIDTNSPLIVKQILNWIRNN